MSRHFATLVDTADLGLHFDDPDWAVVDCRFSLADPARGETAYRQAHIAGAVYAHLDRDLSTPHVSGVTGRHPLPDPAQLAATLGEWGVDRSVQVVAYDDSGGSIAARLWWLLKWLGHDDVAVLDGGWQAWLADAGALATGDESRRPRLFVGHERPELVWDADTVEEARSDTDRLVVDSRSADRYRGENETLDPVAGHIPGALSRPFQDNLGEDGHFLPKEELAGHFEGEFDGRRADQVGFYCGSGVTAAHNILAVAHAGLGQARLYAGSWSEWIAGGKRPVAEGPPTYPTPR